MRLRDHLCTPVRPHSITCTCVKGLSLLGVVPASMALQLCCPDNVDLVGVAMVTAPPSVLAPELERMRPTSCAFRRRAVDDHAGREPEAHPEGGAAIRTVFR